jgi:hypothetical protein
VFIAKWGATDANRSYWFGLQGASGDNTKIAIYERSGSTTSTFNGTTSLSVNTWHHIVYVRNSTQVLLYIDNVSQTFSATNPINNGGTENVVIGQYGGITASTIDGSIDQVRLFGSALSSSQVSELYNEVQCPCTTNTIGYSVDAIGSTTNTSTEAYYKLDGNAYDATANAYNGAWSGTESYSVSPYGVAAVFNGSSSQISAPNITNTSNAVSYSFWIKPNSITLYDFILGHQKVAANYDGLSLLGTAGNTLAISIGGGAQKVMTPSLTLGSWHHIVLTHDGSGNYVVYTDDNGSPITYSGITSNNNANNFLIGYSGVSGWGYYDGDMDQIKVFSSALTSDQVSELYNEVYCNTISTLDVFGDSTGVALYELNGNADSTDSSSNNATWIGTEAYAAGS